jgi:hypothetical protein
MKSRKYLTMVAELGCIICRRPAQIHHIRSGMGLGQRNTNENVIPLCPEHHVSGGHGIAFHAGKKTWQKIYGTEQKLLEETRELLQSTQ